MAAQQQGAGGKGEEEERSGFGDKSGSGNEHEDFASTGVGVVLGEGVVAAIAAHVDEVEVAEVVFGEGDNAAQSELCAEGRFIVGIGGVDDQSIPERVVAAGGDGGAGAEAGEVRDGILVEVSSAIVGEEHIAVEIREHEDIAVHIVGIEIFALKFRDGATVDVAADVGAACGGGVVGGVTDAMVAFADGVGAVEGNGAATDEVPLESCGARGAGDGKTAVGGNGAFALGVSEIGRGRAAVVGIGFKEVDFFAGIFADIGAPDIAGLAVNADAEGIAHTCGKDLLGEGARCAVGDAGGGSGVIDGDAGKRGGRVGSVVEGDGVGGGNGIISREGAIVAGGVGIGVGGVDVDAEQFAADVVGFLFRAVLRSPADVAVAIGDKQVVAFGRADGHGSGAGVEADPVDGVVGIGFNVGILEDKAVDDGVVELVHDDGAAGAVKEIFFNTVNGCAAGLRAGDIEFLVSGRSGDIEVGAESEANEAFITGHAAIAEVHDGDGKAGVHIVAVDTAHAVGAKAGPGTGGGGDAGGIVDNVGGVAGGLGEEGGLCEAGGDAFEVVVGADEGRKGDKSDSSAEEESSMGGRDASHGCSYGRRGIRVRICGAKREVRTLSK